MRKLILVNGIPASGKSSVAKSISHKLNVPVLSIDEIKEPFMLQFSDSIDRSLNRKLGYATYEAMFRIVNSSSENSLFILDAWFGFRERSILENYLAVAQCQTVVEIWNKISPENVAVRYRSRCSCRIKGHPGEEYVPELMVLAEKAQPMALSDVYIVDQDSILDETKMLGWINQHLNRQ